MFYSLTGKLVYSDAGSAAIECGGVAFHCMASFNTLSRLGDTGSTVTLYTHLNVREDALELFGFYDKQELECFRLLISVTGVGPKAALAILSQLTPEKLALSVATGDSKSITKANGVGPKIAQRVVLELKDKLKSYVSENADSSNEGADTGIISATLSSEEAVSALVMLGYSRGDASAAVAKLDGSLDTQALIKGALRLLM